MVVSVSHETMRLPKALIVNGFVQRVHTHNRPLRQQADQKPNVFNNLVGVRGFEPPAPASRTQCSTRLSYTPAKARRIAAARHVRKITLDDTAGNHLLWDRNLLKGGDPVSHCVMQQRLAATWTHTAGASRAG